MNLTDLLESHISESLDTERDDPNWQQRRDAFEISLEQHGQAEWQHARREKPEQFWAAKVLIRSGPEGMTCDVERDIYRDEARFRFEWRRGGKVERIDQRVTRDLLYGDVTYLSEDGALLHMLGSVAFQITKYTGIETSLSVRSNREALAEMRRREEEQKQKAPTP